MSVVRARGRRRRALAFAARVDVHQVREVRLRGPAPRWSRSRWPDRRSSRIEALPDPVTWFVGTSPARWRTARPAACSDPERRARAPPRRPPPRCRPRSRRALDARRLPGRCGRGNASAAEAPPAAPRPGRSGSPASRPERRARALGEHGGRNRRDVRGGAVPGPVRQHGAQASISSSQLAWRSAGSRESALASTVVERRRAARVACGRSARARPWAVAALPPAPAGTGPFPVRHS